MFSNNFFIHHLHHISNKVTNVSKNLPTNMHTHKQTKKKVTAWGKMVYNSSKDIVNSTERSSH